MKKILGVVVAAALIVVAYYSYQNYQRTELIASLTPHLKNASLRVQNSARYELDPETKITFKELFDRLESDITEVDSRLIEVQTLSTPESASITDPAVTYMRSSQEFLRAALQKYRAALSYSTASSMVDDALEELRSSNHYGFEYANRRADKAIGELRKAGEELAAAGPALATAADQLADAAAPLRETFAPDALIDAKVLQEISSKNQATPETPEAETPEAEARE